jgi:transaldolase/glucose-6-phosphate isomerase
VDDRLKAWRSSGFVRGLWAKDPTLWAPAGTPEITNRLGWLDLPRTMRAATADLRTFAAEVKDEGFTHAVVLGMGGSSLAPDVFARTFPRAAGFPELRVLDSTHPAAVAALESRIDLGRTLFLVSSKSGTTIEPLSFFRYFWSRLRGLTNSPGRNFAAITDPGTPLANLGRERGFRRVFLAPPDVGGRFSALTPFGLVPAALAGIDIARLLDRARKAAQAAGPATPAGRSVGLRLGAALGEYGGVRDKLTFLAPRAWEAFPDWLEQLVAESLGKSGRGILPVANEPLVPPAYYGEDRFFAVFSPRGQRDPEIEAMVAALAGSGAPLVRLPVKDAYDLGGQMFVWEVAIAAAGAVLGVHPFNQPDVEMAKDLARKAMASGTAAATRPSRVDSVPADDSARLGEVLEGWLARSRPEDYIALQAYLEPNADNTRALRGLREALLKKTRLATTLGFGPRFLHSTGQYHKGGPNRGLFLQLVDEPDADIDVPDSDYSFGRLIAGQALGDYQALRRKDRRVLRVNLQQDVPGGLERALRALSTS